MTFKPFYSVLAEELNRGSTRASLGLFGFRNHALREHMRNLYQSPAGSGASFLADPVFEATFGWQPADQTIKDLSGSLLHKNLVSALINPAKKNKQYSIEPWEANRHPYQHQLQAWQALKDNNPAQSVIVSSGTGSGKTECFLIPILNDLAKEAESTNQILTGVRALFLYPLNALIKSQRDRLDGWLASDSFNNQIRYCLYKGDTPKKSPPLLPNDFTCEVRGRDVLRKNPPPILVTNATMLEYMLIRDKDKPIIDQSQGQLRWIVIDEAHNYIGSQAAELTLLLRRVLHAFGCRPEQVHFVATSATIAGDGEQSKTILKEFLSQIAGVSQEQVTVVTGSRSIPELEKRFLSANQSFDLATLKEMEAAEKYRALASNPAARALRKSLIQSPQVLTKLTEDFFDSLKLDKRNEMLELLDVCTQAINPECSADDKAFLPLRGHFFHRAQTGLWACVNSHCEGRHGTLLDDSEWGFGKVFLDNRSHCDEPNCASPVFELVQCGECGQEYLAAELRHENAGDKLVARNFVEEEDEYQEQIETANEEEQDIEVNQPALDSKSILLIKDDISHSTRQKLLTNNALVEIDNTDLGILVSQIEPDEKSALRCNCCHKREYIESEVFRPIRLGAPFLLQTSTPTLLQYMKPTPTTPHESLPWDGRRLISFTDSRQGTARFAAKLQQTTERNFVESFLYHRIADARIFANPHKIQELKDQIDNIKQLIENGNQNLVPILNMLETQLEEALNAKPNHLTWVDAKTAIQTNSTCLNWIFPTLRENTGINDNNELAELCLLREFLVRPKRQYSLEGLGLLCLNYRSVQQITLVPPVFSQQNVTLLEWRNLLQVTLDHFVRANKAVQITEDMFRWLGSKGKATKILAPEVGGEGKHWPLTENPLVRRSWLIRFLAYAFNLDINAAEQRNKIDEMLIALWQDIRSCLTQDGPHTYYLNLGCNTKVVEISQVHDAWLCPVTRRLLPVTFRGITPYLPIKLENDELAICQKVLLPKLPTAFWTGTSADEVQQWIETNPEIQTLRELGVWTDLSDRIASVNPYFKTVEHSAQISSSQLTTRENQFKDGKINLMSCSTTMEMGVDIGGLTGVAMNNVPPHPANFLQRAGRAGRRGETASVSFTLCKSNPHGEAVFRNPLWPFTTPLAMPRVSLKSDRIVQRHVNAFCLTEFLKEHVVANPLTYEIGKFFESVDDADSSVSQKFQYWLKNTAINSSYVVEGIAQLTRLSCLEGILTETSLSMTSTMIADVEERWMQEVNALLDNLKEVTTRDQNSRPEKDIKLRLERVRKEYLLRELANRGFLPGYGFPTSVVPLIIKTAEDIDRERNYQANLDDREDDREDIRVIKERGPARGLSYALRDYAPGTDTVVNQRVYRCSGVTLNWHIPATADAGPEIQSRRYAWQCNRCGGAGTKAIWPKTCPQCGHLGNEFEWKQYLVPAGFAVDIRYKTHNDISLPQYIPVKEPWISLDGADWLYLSTSQLGRYRYSSSGSLFQYTDGLHGTGYGICLKCGRADSMKSDGNFSSVFLDDHGHSTHKRLRGGKENNQRREIETECPGSQNLVIPSISLGMETHTDIFELQLRNTSANLVTQKSAYSLAVSLREALARQLGVEARELGFVVRPSLDVYGENTFSIYLFDTASDGAGYVTQANKDFNLLFKEARKILECIKQCDTACHCCLLSYDTQYKQKYLDRHTALEILNDDFLLGLSLPHDLQVFGTATKLEVEPIRLALQRELRKRKKVTLIRLHLAGAPELWEPLEWSLREDLLRIRSTGALIELVIDKNDFNQFSSDLKNQLAALISVVGANAYVYESDVNSQMPLSILAVNHEQGSTQWASSCRDALAPNSNWGSSAEENIFVIGLLDHVVNVVPDNWTKLLPSELQIVEANTIAISITSELNGSLQSFGDTAWELILEKAPELCSLLKSQQVLTQISYSDRYLRSPETVVFLRAFMLGLKKIAGNFLVNSSFKINTCPIDLRNSNTPRFTEHDWRDAQDRKDVIEQIFQSGYGRFIFTEYKAYDLHHARVLELAWDDGTQWEIRLDQGFGYWRSKTKETFPFERGVPKQSEVLSEMSFNVINASNLSTKIHPTFIYIVKRKAIQNENRPK